MQRLVHCLTLFFYGRQTILILMLLYWFLFGVGSVLGGADLTPFLSDATDRVAPQAAVYTAVPDTTDDAVAKARAALALPAPRAAPPRDLHPVPGITLNTPTAFGARLGQIYGGVHFQHRIRYANWQDGVISGGAGLGDPQRWVGLDMTLTMLDTYTDLGEDMALSWKLHRQFGSRWAVAIGHENMWHTDGTDGGSSRYAVVSHVLRPNHWHTTAFIVSAGIGNDRFLPERQFQQRADGLNAFGSVAARVHPAMHVVANWTGQDLALGLSVTPFERVPLVFSPALVDLTGHAGDGVRFSASLGMALTLW
ncbi:hypothetical protein CRI93_12725 [Longimonas halophila]|uniref:Uncharacterized protein n=1 Tax=Longimonas halophila TaxID=1469170 RepID=A0A2H3NJ72_9BACT|nr:hypothetical protein [Longimonas halophila]PEN05553.1 hypothetical protein CRI93_12725 [Longimonas halophila]